MSKPKKEYRPNVGIMVVNREGKVFVARRADHRSKAWQMPQGGIDKGENPLKAAFRELEEETGIKTVRLIAESKEWHAYDFPKGVTFTSEKKRSFKGQAQKWFLFMFDGDEKEIDLDQKHPEFDGWMWTDVEKVPDLIIEFKREVYEKVVSEFLSFVDAIRASSD